MTEVCLSITENKVIVSEVVQNVTVTLVGVQGPAGSAVVDSVFGRIGDIVAEAGDYDASQVTNAFDVSSDDSDIITEGSTNLFLTTAERSKLAAIEAGAQVNQDAFSTVAVAGQDSIVADQEQDTLNIAAGANITITTNQLTDTLTIEAATTVVPVDSVFGRTGAVVAQAGDYTAAQVTNAFDKSVNTSDNIAEGTTNLFFTAAEQTKLAGIQAGAQVNTVDSVNGQTGTVTLDKTDIGLGNVDNTSDLNKPISTATQAALNTKLESGDNVSELVNDAGYITSAPVDSVNGQTGAVVLDADDISDAATTNKYTNAADISKLAGIQAGAEVNQNAYSTFAVSGQSDVVADAKQDTVNFVAGTNVTITTDDATDSITINATGGTPPVDSVFGRTGVVTAQSGDYTAAQVTNAFDKTADDTDDITEGATNLFFTDEKVDDRVADLIQDGTGITWTYDDGLGTLTGDVTLQEGINAEDEGSSVTGGPFTTVNFVGTGVTASDAGSGELTVTIPGGSGTVTLQDAYDDGSTIAISNTQGPVIIDATSSTDSPLQITPDSAPTTDLSGGQFYYDSTLNKLMNYDSTRSKFLSVEAHQYTFSRNGNTDGQFLRVGHVINTTRGYKMPFDGTIVAIEATGAANLTKGFSIYIGGVADVITFNLSSGAFSDTAENVNFSAGDEIQCFATATGVAVSDAIVTLYIHWRT